MGILSQLSSMLGLSKKPVNILIIGLDNSGKSSILNQMKPNDIQSTQIISTVGYNVENFISNKMNFCAFDMSGQGKYRNLWEAYYKDAEAIVFVVDSNDRLRVAVARDELWLLLDHKDLLSKKIPLLVFANKMDEKGSMNASEVSQCLGMDLIRNRNWHICASCALTGQGLEQGFEWLVQNIRSNLESKK